MKKRVLGVRPIERELEDRDDAEAEAIRGYCGTERSAITDDGRHPFEAPRVESAQATDKHLAELATRDLKKGIPKQLERLNCLVERGLTETAALWRRVQTAFG